jgi:hypothetical protein
MKMFLGKQLKPNIPRKRYHKATLIRYIYTKYL